MFLIRAAFWLALVAALLPEPRAELVSLAPQLEREAKLLGAPDILAMAAERAADLAQICERNARICETGTAAFAKLQKRISGSATDVWNMFGAGYGSAEPLLRRRQPTGGTLSPADLEPDWSAPVNGRKV